MMTEKTEPAAESPPKSPPAAESWPLGHDREPPAWLPAGNRLINLVRSHPDSYVLPPAVIRKANWRE